MNKKIEALNKLEEAYSNTVPELHKYVHKELKNDIGIERINYAKEQRTAIENSL